MKRNEWKEGDKTKWDWSPYKEPRFLLKRHNCLRLPAGLHDMTWLRGEVRREGASHELKGLVGRIWPSAQLAPFRFRYIQPKLQHMILYDTNQDAKTTTGRRTSCCSKVRVRQSGPQREGISSTRAGQRGKRGEEKEQEVVCTEVVWYEEALGIVLRFW